MSNGLPRARSSYDRVPDGVAPSAGFAHRPFPAGSVSPFSPHGQTVSPHRKFSIWGYQIADGSVLVVKIEKFLIIDSSKGSDSWVRRRSDNQADNTNFGRRSPPRYSGSRSRRRDSRKSHAPWYCTSMRNRCNRQSKPYRKPLTSTYWRPAACSTIDERRPYRVR